jgi:hypothetical protein
MQLLKPMALGLTLAASLLAFNHPVMAQDKPSVSASRTVTMSATVTEIDHDTRMVTLQGPEGESVSFTASPDVRNLAQVEVGDIVLAQMHEEVTIEVVANPESIEPGTGEFVAEARAEMGELPGGGVLDTVVITAVVEEINLETNSFKLRGPEGNVREFAARDPENLKRAEVGDLVVITITQAMGIMVEQPGS